MKNIATTILKFFGQAGVVALFVFATAGPAFAETITKSFEFGTGTVYSRSVVRTFQVPCGLPAEAQVKFQRHGPDSSDSDIQIKIELRKPDTGPDQEGPIASTENAFAKRAQQTLTLSSPETNRGCSLPWRVRVRHANEGAAPFTVYGSITFKFTIGNPRIMGVEGSPFNLSKNSSTTKNLGGSGGFLQGAITITATWVHYVQGLYPIPGPFPVVMRFELIDPSGQVVASDSGYSNTETASCCVGNKMKVTFRVSECTTGQWKIKVTNLSSLNDAGNIQTNATFTPDCL